MDRRRLPWLLALPLMVAGSLSAHVLGQRLFAGAMHGIDHAASGEGASAALDRSHGAGTFAPVILGVALAILLVKAYAHLTGREGLGSVPPAMFLVLPPLGYSIQEITERLLHAESFARNPVHEPAFLAALVLQLPFGWLAYRVASFIRDAARRALAVLSHSWSGPVAAPPTLRAPAPFVFAARLLVLARGHPARGPPALA